MGPSHDTNAAVTAAFDATPRAWFLPRSLRGRADHDGPLLIGDGQTNSQPVTVENMLMLLDVRPGHRVLDVGAGSGWTTALLAHLVGESGAVHGVEIRPDLVTLGQANLATANRPWASITQATSGMLGIPETAPFDRILVSAEADSLPDELVAQLGPDGIMVIPVRQTMVRVRRTATGVETTEHGAYAFVPLI